MDFQHCSFLAPKAYQLFEAMTQSFLIPLAFFFQQAGIQLLKNKLVSGQFGVHCEQEKTQPCSIQLSKNKMASAEFGIHCQSLSLLLSFQLLKNRSGRGRETRKEAYS